MGFEVNTEKYCCQLSIIEKPAETQIYNRLGSYGTVALCLERLTPDQGDMRGTWRNK
jgi:hypothetical protein